MPTSYLSLGEEGRESQLLRASVIETAMNLGPKVTDWIFDNHVIEEDTEGGYREQTPTLGRSPSTSSNESHSSGLPSYDGHVNELDLKVHGSHLQISLPDTSAALENGHYLNSPFVMIQNEGNLPLPDVLACKEKSVPRRKSVKNFRFGKKRKDSVPALDVKQLSISAPHSIQSSLDDPVVPSLLPDSEGSTPESSPLKSNSPLNPSGFNTLNTAIKRHKSVRERRDWDFKDPDRLSFFFQQQCEIDKHDGKDAGYTSESAGSRFKSGRGNGDHKLEKMRPLKRSMTDRIRQTRKWFSTDLRDYVQPPKSISKSLPPHERFTRKQPQLRGTSNPSSNSNSGWKSSLPGAASEYQRRDMLTSPASSASSFALLPDLNAAKRLGLDKYTSNRDVGIGGLVGADNKVKLEMLTKLLNDRPPLPDSMAAESVKKSLAPRSPHHPQRPAPPLLNTTPLLGKNEYRSPHSVDSPTVTVKDPSVQGNHSPLHVRVQQAQSPVRGREAPFPTKPICRETPRFKILSPQLLVPPRRYMHVDVPRSVRSTFTKDLDLEDEERDEEDRQSRENNDRDDLSAYSNTSMVVNDDAEGRAELMDAERSKEIRAMLMKNMRDINGQRAYF